MNISIPYGKTRLTCDMAGKNLLGIFESKVPEAAPDELQEVKRALDTPIGSPRLEDLAKGKNTAVIILSDHTRPVPSKFLIPEMLRRLRLGNPELAITLLVATGCHRSTTSSELEAKLGSEIVNNEKIVIHDASDETSLVNLGILPSGGKLILNKIAAEADLLVSEGFIEPHFFAGFSGGRKAVLPGIASRQTVYANHCAEFIQHPFARTGNLDNNPIHRDMIFAAKTIGLAFILNVIIDSNKKIVKAFAGDCEEAHKAGCNFLSSFADVQVPEADIVITSNGGYPLDQNIYQSVKGMTAGEAAVRAGGVIILVASCLDGHGGEAFFQKLSTMTADELWQETLATPRNATLPDQWQYQILARVMRKAHVILVTTDCDHAILNKMHLDAANTLDEALDKAYALLGKNASIAVIPDGVSVIVRKATAKSNK